MCRRKACNCQHCMAQRMGHSDWFSAIYDWRWFAIIDGRSKVVASHCFRQPYTLSGFLRQIVGEGRTAKSFGSHGRWVIYLSNILYTVEVLSMHQYIYNEKWGIQLYIKRFTTKHWKVMNELNFIFTDFKGFEFIWFYFCFIFDYFYFILFLTTLPINLIYNPFTTVL